MPANACKTCLNQEIKLSDDAQIIATVVNNFNCISSDTVNIRTFCPTTTLFIPNAFTPDGDGVNDKLIIRGSGIKQIRNFRIFSRWGEKVFERLNFIPGDVDAEWDGKIRGKNATPDEYVYMCEVICEKGLPSIFKGNVAILK